MVLYPVNLIDCEFFFVIILNLLLNTEMHMVRGSGLVPWPKRLTEAPPRLEEIGVSAEEFHEDTVCFCIYSTTENNFVYSVLFLSRYYSFTFLHHLIAFSY